jgi:hypothetical protein
MNQPAPFHLKRRQQFLGEDHYRAQLSLWEDVIARQLANLSKPEGSDRGWHGRLLQGIAGDLYVKLSLRYTAGEPIEPLRAELEAVVAAYERYGEHLWKHTGDRNDWVFDFDDLDVYCELMQLVGLCFLLHRRDLLPRIAALQDGLDAVGQKGQGAGGADWLFEEFMSYAVGPENRYESETIHWSRTYEALADAMSSADNPQALKDVDRFLKHWYKTLAGTGWHDSHKPDENGDQGGYYGYWSFEAGAAVLLLGIEDDSPLRKYLYYPKDLVAWARDHSALTAPPGPGGSAATRLRCEAGQPCPRAGWWSTPAQEDSRRRFEPGQSMPAVAGDYGATIWQFEERQDG